MAVIEEPELDVELASTDEIESAASAALMALGLTYSELRDQARAGSFDSERARLVWLVVRDVAADTPTTGT